MKKSIFLAVAAVAMTACSNDVDLGMKDANKQTADNAIGFEVRNSNMSRANLESAGHYNFGVFGYKNATTGEAAIMEDYLVGFNGTDASGKKVGYFFSDGQTTNGDGSNAVPGLSKWAYEKLGKDSSTDYKYTGNEGYYKNGCDNPNDDDTYYMSNWANQFLRYWDKSTSWTNFYAYSPYYHSSDYENSKVSFDNNDHKMTFPAGYIQAGYNDVTKYEYLYAATSVENGQYRNDVALTFKHLNSKINITFYEEIEGYKVTMIDLVSGVGISAAPSDLDDSTDPDTYTYGTVYKSAGASLTFGSANNNTGDPTVAASNFTGTAYSNTEYIQFKKPTASFIATNKPDAISKTENYSPDTYYAIPKDNNTGLMFHVSFKLTNEDTNETITVSNATVYVPKANCNWEAGKWYRYIFKITKNTTGKTENPGTVDPADPKPSDPALFPIVFDGIEIDGWGTETDSDHNIN